MQSRIAQSMNEIVSLTILALMCVALVAGQAGASQRESAIPSLNVSATDSAEPADTRLLFEQEWLAIDEPSLKLDVTFRFRHAGE